MRGSNGTLLFLINVFFMFTFAAELFNRATVKSVIQELAIAMIDQALADEGEIRGLIGWELLFFNQRFDGFAFPRTRHIEGGQADPRCKG